jgi:hypothetical protein
MKAAPVPWSLAWREDGELGSQDRFDLLQTLVAHESHEIQMTLIAAVESLCLSELQEVTACEEVSRMCA